jgi:hypothetical protein
MGKFPSHPNDRMQRHDQFYDRKVEFVGYDSSWPIASLQF